MNVKYSISVLLATQHSYHTHVCTYHIILRSAHTRTHTHSTHQAPLNLNNSWLFVIIIYLLLRCHRAPSHIWYSTSYQEEVAERQTFIRSLCWIYVELVGIMMAVAWKASQWIGVRIAVKMNTHMEKKFMALFMGECVCEWNVVALNCSIHFKRIKHILTFTHPHTHVCTLVKLAQNIGCTERSVHMIPPWQWRPWPYQFWWIYARWTISVRQSVALIDPDDFMWNIQPYLLSTHVHFTHL